MTYLIDGDRLESWLHSQQQHLIESARERHEQDGPDDHTALRMDGAAANIHLIRNALKNFESGKAPKTPLASIAPATETKVRRKDPSTSFEAALEQTPDKSRRLYIAIIRVLTAIGPKTDEEIIDFFEVKNFAHTPSGVRSRRKELVEAGWIEDSGEKRLTIAGSPSTVWRAVQ